MKKPRLTNKKIESLVAKALVSLAGVKGFLAIVLQKVIVIFYNIVKEDLKEKRDEKITEREEVKEKKYEESLKDGVSEKQNEDDTLDFLNLS